MAPGHIDPAHGGCCVVTGYTFRGGSWGELAHCRAPVAYAGSHTYVYPRRQAVRAFACAEHRDWIDNPRPYGSIPEHAREMARRLAGKPPEGR